METTSTVDVPEIDEAMAGLDDLAEVPPAEQVARFAAVHDALTSALNTIDDGLPTTASRHDV